MRQDKHTRASNALKRQQEELREMKEKQMRALAKQLGYKVIQK